MARVGPQRHRKKKIKKFKQIKNYLQDYEYFLSVIYNFCPDYCMVNPLAPELFFFLFLHILYIKCE